MKKVLYILVIASIINFTICNNGEVKDSSGSEIFNEWRKKSEEPMKKRDHPTVQHHRDWWFKNWATCVICKEWVETLETEVSQSEYVKALKGFLWTVCATTYS